MPQQSEIKTTVVEATGKAVHFYKPVLEGYGAPKLASLTECNAPDLPKWEKHLANTILNTIFLGINWPPGVQRYVLNFMRRMETAVDEYRRGREELQNYVAELPRRNNHFLGALRALSHFEQSCAALYQALCLTPPFTGIKEFFKKGDNSPEEHLNAIYNRSKHFEEGAGQDTPPPATPVWLTNEGIECTDCTLTFAELHGVILDLTKVAEFISLELPKRLQEKRAQASTTDKSAENSAK